MTILALSPLFYSPMRDGTAYYGNNSIYLAFQVGVFFMVNLLKTSIFLSAWDRCAEAQ
jgi:hypothetical protein